MAGGYVHSWIRCIALRLNSIRFGFAALHFAFVALRLILLRSGVLLRSTPLRFISDSFRICVVFHSVRSVCFVRSVPLRFGADAVWKRCVALGCAAMG